MFIKTQRFEFEFEFLDMCDESEFDTGSGSDAFEESSIDSLLSVSSSESMGGRMIGHGRKCCSTERGRSHCRVRRVDDVDTSNLGPAVSDDDTDHAFSSTHDSDEGGTSHGRGRICNQGRDRGRKSGSSRGRVRGCGRGNE